MRAAFRQLRALILVVCARVLLPRIGTTATLRRLAGRYGGGVGIARAWTISVDGWEVHAVCRAGGIVGASCLAQSVALCALYERAGRSPTLVLGCRRYAGNERPWGAHAWVQLGEEILEPVPAPEHSEIARLDAKGEWLPTALS